MRQNVRKGHLIIKAVKFLGLFLLPAFTVNAQEIPIPTIPKEWALHIQNSMNAVRDTLIKHLKAYDNKVNDFNLRCGMIPADNKTLFSACQQESDALDIESDAIDKERDRFFITFHDNERIYKAYKESKEFQEKEQEKIDKIVFDKSIHEDSTHYENQLQKLMDDVGKINVPSPVAEKKIHEGVMLGLFNTHDVNAITNENKSVTSAFTDNEYNTDEYFATSDDLSAKELLRGVVDNNYLGEYTLNSEQGKKLIEQLEGTKFDRLIAHSNGATVSEALIRKGVITVDELNIIGGDRSLINYFGYNELLSSGKVKRVVVWVNPGDIIPYGTTAGLLAPAMAGHYLKTAEDYLIAKVTGQSKGGDAGVEYRFLKGPQYKGQDLKFGKDVFDAHGLDVYEYNMKQYFTTNK